MTLPSFRDLDTRGAFGAESIGACACCGAPSVALDAHGRCPGAVCALASRVDSEVPCVLTAMTLRASRLAFALRSVVVLSVGRVAPLAVAA